MHPFGLCQRIILNALKGEDHVSCPIPVCVWTNKNCYKLKKMK